MDFTKVSGLTIAEGKVAKITDSTGNVLFGKTTENVPNVPLEITTTSLPDGKLKNTYSTNLAANQSSGVAWSKAGGSLPPGLKLISTGQITGTPTKAGTYTFSVKVANKTETASKTFTMKVAK